MDVLMVGVRVARNDVLVIGKAHPIQIPGGNLPPLVIGQVFTGMDR
jgi:hypothetical protein